MSFGMSYGMRCGIGIALAACVAVAPIAGAQDHEREQRWASQIVPSLVVGDAVSIRTPGGRDFLGIYTVAPGSKAAVLLVHGVGVHPDHGVIGVLRASLAESGLTTLSIQMPVAAAAATMEDYCPALFPDAVERIGAAARWLADKGQPRIVLLSHSMGSWMSNVYFEQTGNPPFAAWICMGLTGGFGGMGNVKVPVLDLYGEHDLAQVTRAGSRRRFALRSIEGSKQVMIAGADHHYTGHEKGLDAAIREFIGTLR